MEEGHTTQGSSEQEVASITTNTMTVIDSSSTSEQNENTNNNATTIVESNNTESSTVQSTTVLTASGEYMVHVTESSPVMGVDNDKKAEENDQTEVQASSNERPHRIRPLPRPAALNGQVPSFTYDPTNVLEENHKGGPQFLSDPTEHSDNSMLNFTTRQRRLSTGHKRSTSDVSGLWSSNHSSISMETSPIPSSSTTKKKPFTLFGFAFGKGNTGASSQNSSPQQQSSSTATPSSMSSTPNVGENIATTTTSVDTTSFNSRESNSSSEKEEPTQKQVKKRASDDVSLEILEYLNEKTPNKPEKTISDEEIQKRRQGMHISQPLNGLIYGESTPEKRSASHLDLLGFLGEMKQMEDPNSANGMSRNALDSPSITAESREATTSGFKSFLDKVRGKTIFSRVSSPMAPGDGMTEVSLSDKHGTSSDSLSVTDDTSQTSATPQKVKKLSEKEIRKQKLLERENSQKEMMDGILEKINKSGESFAHISFFDENDQEWQYIGYIQKYDNTMTDDELYMMYALMGVGGNEDAASKHKKEISLDGSGGVFGDSCVMPVLSRLCGRGELRYPNGATYEGDIIRGKRHGFGKMIFPFKSSTPSTPTTKKASEKTVSPTSNVAIAIGQWLFNNPSEAIPFKVNYGDDEEYWGTFKVKSKFSSAYVIGIGDLDKHKEGELYHVRENKKYFGGFQDDMKDGFGVEIYANGERYYGGWKGGCHHYFGTFQYVDGTYFQGEFKKGIRRGKGKLYLATGDVIEGTWYGDKIESAVFKKGNCKNVELTHLYQLKTQINDAIKLFHNVGFMDDSNYLQFLRMTKKETIQRPELELKWKYYSLMNKETWRSEKKQLAEFYAKSEKSNSLDITDKVTFKNEIMRLLGETTKSDGPLPPATNFVKGFTEFFESLFHGSYYSGNNRNQSSARKVTSKNSDILYNAIDDLKSFVIYLCDQVVWDFFGNDILGDKLLSNPQPSTNDSDMTFVNDEQGQVDEDDDEIIFGTGPVMVDSSRSKFNHPTQAYHFCKTIVADHLHRKLYSTIFELYEFHFRDQDLLMNQKINSILTSCRLQNFGVNEDFIPKTSANLSPKPQIPYQECLQLMKDVKFSNSVESKVRILSQLRTTAMQAMKRVKIENKKLKKMEAGEGKSYLACFV